MPQSQETPRVEATADGEAMEQFRSEIAAMTDEEVLTPRVDVVASALIAIGAMPEIEAQRGAIVAIFGDAAGRTIDRLGPAARGVLSAQGEVLTATDHDLEVMAKDLMEVRTQLFLAASALIERGLVAKKSLTQLTGGQSYQARVTDTIALTKWFRKNAAKIATRTKVDDAELVRAEAITEAFTTAFAEREQAGAGSGQSARERARMFTIFFRTYERVRQLLSYVRWHKGDVEQIAPSLYTRSPRKQDDHEVAPAPTHDVVPPGMPGANPFPTTA
jgi:hypothetical protein